MKTKQRTHQVTPFFLAIPLAVVCLLPAKALGESEKCDPFTIAAKNGPPPMTILRTGLSPIVSIAGQLYHYDVTSHCLRDSSKASANVDCAKPQKVMSGGKVVAMIEGQSKVTITPVDSRGLPNRSGIYYQMMVEHDAYRSSQPRFWLEAVNPQDAVTGLPKTVGRLDSVEGLTVDQLVSNKGRLASGHKLINMNGSSLMYVNCRKLTVTRFDDRYYPSYGRTPASGEAHLAQPPRPVMVARQSSKK